VKSENNSSPSKNRELDTLSPLKAGLLGYLFCCKPRNYETKTKEGKEERNKEHEVEI
jgi:hypothetical protein